MSRLWKLAENGQHIDSQDLLKAIEEELQSPDLDYRTQQLIQESAAVLREQFHLEVPGIGSLPHGDALGFPSLRRRVKNLTRPQQIEDFLRQIGKSLTHSVEVVIGDSSSLILQGILERQTEDVDLVDEIPQPIRELGSKLRDAETVSDLYLAHFQSHYLPEGWRSRLHSRGSYGRLVAQLVDGLDIFTGKLFSLRVKDQKDLRSLLKVFPKERLSQHLRACARQLASDEKLCQAAEFNWFALFGDDLPPRLANRAKS